VKHRTEYDLDLVEARMVEQSRQSFWAYRQYMRPKLKMGWFHRQVAHDLQAFGEALMRGEAPILLIQAPPQHGKTWAVIDFVSWLAGKDPDRQAIYSSFSERLGIRANLMLQRTYDSAKYQKVFPGTLISSKVSATISGLTQRNREIIEYVGRDGYFRNTTVRGPITGEGMGLGIIDDPVKGREEANSPTMRNKTWEWFTDDFMTRFTDDAGVLGIMTRWNVDDIFGRLMKMRPDAIVRKYPAIAEEDEEHRKEGEALFPELKSIEFLLRQKSTQSDGSWQSLYQQNPSIQGGNMFKDDWWKFLDVPPPVVWRAIYADTAQKTKTSNDFSVLQCWGASTTGQAILLDMLRGRWEAPELLEMSRAFWAKHKAVTGMGKLRKMGVEDKVSGTTLIQTLRREGIPTIAIQRNTDKVMRAQDTLPYIESGNVVLLRGVPGLSEMLEEARGFPNAKFDDTLDPMMDAVDDMCGGPKLKNQLTW
jgi:predicted phage terminase large subunit-like protein